MKILFHKLVSLKNLLKKRLISTKPLTPQVVRRKNFHYYKNDINSFLGKVAKQVVKTSVVLDVGCGIRPMTFFEPKVHICIEPFKQYREVIKPFFPNSSQFIFLKEDALTAMKIFDNLSIDSVIMLDLIEHLSKKKGKQLIKEAERIARKQIVIFTPYGFMPQHSDQSGLDAWGLNGDEFQSHKSGWVPKDFDSDWDFHICKDCHIVYPDKYSNKSEKYSALFAIKNKVFTGFPVQKDTPRFVVEFNQKKAKKNVKKNK